MMSFKILGLLLGYPQEAVITAGHEIMRALRAEALLPPRTLKAIEAFVHQRQRDDLLVLQEEYVETFDRGRAHCLHLFEHVHGESRDRGQAMVDLAETYAAKGLFIDTNELPDYLPLFLEYLSLCPLDEATALLGEAIDIIAAIGVRLKKRSSPYVVIFDAIETLSRIKPDKHRVQKVVESAPKDPETLAELDAQWKEADAFDGVSQQAACSGCPSFSDTAGSLHTTGGVQ